METPKATIHNTPFPPDTLDVNKENSVEFHASGGLLNILNEICDEYGLSRTESIRKAIALFFIAKREQAKGNRLVVMNNNEIISEITSF
jgi:hypothetical protein